MTLTHFLRGWNHGLTAEYRRCFGKSQIYNLLVPTQFPERNSGPLSQCWPLGRFTWLLAPVFSLGWASWEVARAGLDSSSSAPDRRLHMPRKPSIRPRSQSGIEFFSDIHASRSKTSQSKRKKKKFKILFFVRTYSALTSRLFQSNKEGD